MEHLYASLSPNWAARRADCLKRLAQVVSDPGALVLADLGDAAPAPARCKSAGRPRLLAAVTRCRLQLWWLGQRIVTCHACTGPFAQRPKPFLHE